MWGAKMLRNAQASIVRKFPGAIDTRGRQEGGHALLVQPTHIVGAAKPGRQEASQTVHRFVPRGKVTGREDDERGRFATSVRPGTLALQKGSKPLGGVKTFPGGVAA